MHDHNIKRSKTKTKKQKHTYIFWKILEKFLGIKFPLSSLSSPSTNPPPFVKKIFFKNLNRRWFRIHTKNCAKPQFQINVNGSFKSKDVWYE